MPKYKKSPGKITIATPHIQFCDYIRKELYCAKEWNPHWIETDGVTFTTKQWKIVVLATKIIVYSEKPVVHLRHGFRILMGQGRIEIS